MGVGRGENNWQVSIGQCDEIRSVSGSKRWQRRRQLFVARLEYDVGTGGGKVGALCVWAVLSVWAGWIRRGRILMPLLCKLGAVGALCLLCRDAWVAGWGIGRGKRLEKQHQRRYLLHRHYLVYPVGTYSMYLTVWLGFLLLFLTCEELLLSPHPHDMMCNHKLYLGTYCILNTPQNHTSPQPQSCTE